VRERRKRDRERPCKQYNERGRERDREVRERERERPCKKDSERVREKSMKCECVREREGGKEREV